MDRIEFIKDNFLGISYYEQQQILEYLMIFLKENRMNKLLKKFNTKFDKYLNKIKLLLEFKDAYIEFNSNKRRLIRKTLLEELKETAYNHHIDNSKERIKQHFRYSSEYYGEYIKYFEAKTISSDEVQKFLIDFSNLDFSKKCDFIEDMIFFYNRINKLSLPYPDNMLNDYKPIIQDIIGNELMEYYNRLYLDEQMQLILKIVVEFKYFKYDVDYYNMHLKAIKDDSKIIRVLKKETIDYCQRKFL